MKIMTREHSFPSSLQCDELQRDAVLDARVSILLESDRNSPDVSAFAPQRGE